MITGELLHSGRIPRRSSVLIPRPAGQIRLRSVLHRRPVADLLVVVVRPAVVAEAILPAVVEMVAVRIRTATKGCNFISEDLQEPTRKEWAFSFVQKRIMATVITLGGRSHQSGVSAKTCNC
jgi:hypothetical protein